MSALRQIVGISALNLRTLPQRSATSAVTILSFAGLIGVLVATLAMDAGVSRTFGSGARADRAVVITKGADSEGNSILNTDQIPIITDVPGVSRTADGAAIVSADHWTMLEATTRAGVPMNVTLRGVGAQFFDLRPEVKLTEGRMFQPALHELIVGKAARAQFRGLEIGDRVKTISGDWTIVGAFESGGGPHESELLASAATVLSAFNENYYRVVTAKLDSPAAFAAYRDALQTNPALSVEVKRETDYFAEKSKPLARLLFYVAYVVGGIMAAGALFGALNMMYAAVATRRIEIATLRAIGFGGTAVAISVLSETLLLALVGATIGIGVAWLLFDGYLASSSASYFAGGQLMFVLTVTPGIVGTALLWALTVGLLGGLPPAIRAARLPVSVALRAS